MRPRLPQETSYGPGVQLTSHDPLAVAATTAIRDGDLEALRRLLVGNPELASASVGAGDGTGRSMLHIATDWPGHFPNNVETVKLLIAAGADVNARFHGAHTETPLHWTASSDDVDVLDALLDAGADIEACGAVIAGGTALADATAFGQWRAATRLIDRGARSTLFESAAMGVLDRISAYIETDSAGPIDISSAFWAACHGGQLAAAEFLLSKRADIDWASPWDGLTPLGAARRSEMPAVVEWLIEHGATSSKP